MSEQIATNLGLGREFIAKAENLFQHGLDSFGFIELVTAIEGRYGVQFSEDELMSADFVHVRGISQLIHQKVSGQA